MKSLFTSLLFITLLATSASAQLTIEGRDNGVKKADITAESLELVQLSDISSFPTEEQAMWKVALQWIESKGESADEYYAKIDSTKSTAGETQILLYHKTAFKVLTDAQNHGITTMKGNPGGKCKTLFYNTSSKKVEKEWWWQ